MKNIFRLVRLGGLLFVVFCLFSTTNPLHAQWIQTNGPYGGYIKVIAVKSNGYVFAGTDGGGIYRSTDNGGTWINVGFTGRSVGALVINSSGTIFAEMYGGGVYYSDNNGASWTQISNDATNSIISLVINFSGDIFIANGGVMRSTDNGASWTQVNSGLTSTYIFALAVNSSGILFAGTADKGVFCSTNNGTSWSQVNSGLTSIDVYTLAINSNGDIFAGTTSGGAFRSTDNGASWTQINNGFPYVPTVLFITFNSSGHVFAGTNSAGLFRSTNNGASWSQVLNTTNNYFYAIATKDSTVVYAGTTGTGIFRSTDNGGSWNQVNTGLSSTHVTSVAINSNGSLFAGVNGSGIFRSTDNGGSWMLVTNGPALFIQTQSLAINSNGYIFSGTDEGVYRSTDNGTSWTQLINSYSFNDIYALSISNAAGSNGYIYVGTYCGGIFRSTDNGNSWTQVNSGLTNSTVLSLAVNSSGHVFAGTNGGAFCGTTDNGGVFRSIDNGVSWSQNLAGRTVFSLAVNSAGYCFAGTDASIYRSTDDGITWNQLADSPQGVRSLDINSFGYIFAGGAGGVFLSTNNGTNWTPASTGLANTNVWSLAVSGTDLFAGTRGGGVWRRPLSEMITSVILSVDSVNTYANDTVLVPIRVIFPSSNLYSSAELSFSGFQHNGLNFLGLDTTSSMMTNKGWQIQFNNTDTLLITASAGAQDITGSGVLFNLKFVLTGNPCTFVPITITKAVFNTGVDSVAVSNGGVHIKAVPVYGDVDGNGQVQAYDASLILKSLVGETTLDCQALANAIVNCQDTLMAYDATLILQNVVRLITLPSCSVIEAAGNLTMPETLATGSSSFAVPINLSNGSNILSFEGAVDYDTSALHFDGINWGSSLGSFSKEAKAEKGRIMMAAASATEDGHTGVFASIKFTLHGSVTQTTVTLKKSRWNAGKIVQNVGSCIVTLAAVGIPIAKSGYPTEFSLSQNYPNPFNPTTSIRFALPRSSYVTLQVFNLLGQEVAALINEELPAGYHGAVWDASKMPSGMYFYRLVANAIPPGQAGSFNETKKLILLR